MTAKKKYEQIKAKAIQLFEERPLETLAVASMTITAVAKLISSATQARNSRTWQREVDRRERKQSQGYQPRRR